MNFVKFLRAPISIEHLWWLSPTAAENNEAQKALCHPHKLSAFQARNNKTMET